jgi:16S rRNA G527 N7-methylase RsmG
MNSEDLARYIEHIDGIAKPWLLIQLRLQKLQENRHNIDSALYISQLEELHQALMDLGEWWVGREDEVF